MQSGKRAVPEKVPACYGISEKGEQVHQGLGILGLRPYCFAIAPRAKHESTTEETVQMALSLTWVMGQRDMTTVKPRSRIGRHSTFFIVVSWFAALCAALAAGPPRYTVVLLGEPYEGMSLDGNFMRPWQLNNKGDIVGVSPHGLFLLRGRTVQHFGNLAVPIYGSLTDINDHGVILGLDRDSSLPFPQAFLSYVIRSSGPKRDLDEKRRTLPIPGFLARDVNNHGAIVGAVFHQDGTSQAVIYEHGRLRELPGQMPLGHAFAFAINDRGQIIGTQNNRPVLWSNGRLQQLALPAGYTDGYGMAINDHGVAVGWCHNPQLSTGFIYRDGVVRLLPRPDGAQTFAATKINNAGDVLFHFQSDRLGNGYWLYSRGRLYDLAPIVARDAGWQDVGFFELLDMNDHGAIVGTATYFGREGRRHQGILLIPKDQRDDRPAKTIPIPHHNSPFKLSRSAH